MRDSSKKPRPKGFVFVDRSGKVHGARKGPESDDPAPSAPRGEGRIVKVSEGKPRPTASKAKASPRTPEKSFHKKSGKGSGRGGPSRSEERDQPRHTGKGKRPFENKNRGRGPVSDQRARVVKATVDKNRKGFGFLIFEDRKIEDAFVNPREADRLFHGDRVQVTLRGRGEISDVQVLEHRFRELVGHYMPHPSGRGGLVVYERKRAREEVYVPENVKGVSANDWVRAKLVFHEPEARHPVTAEIIEIYGNILPASADVGMIAAEYNLIEEHPAAAEREARTFELKIDDWRTDLRKVPFITIDGETARDFDDAIYVERAKSGFVLWVAIADVSYYVEPGTALDDDARSRGTSVYFPERAFHMLPRALSENLCSLKPNEPRLTMVARMELNYKGERIKTEVMEAVIQSHRRATYNEIQAEWEEHQRDKNWEFAPHFALYEQIRKRRGDRGSIDFDLPEAEVKVDPQGNPISITLRARLDAHRLIEEFMITANEAVTEWIMDRGWPFVFRVHEEPAPLAIAQFEKMAKTMGADFKFKGGNLNQALAEFVKRIEGHPAQELLNMQLLRSMKRAVYSSAYGIHFGLASNAYTHFTSPIRRYPDLVVHRLLRRALRTEKGLIKPLNKKEREVLEAELTDVTEHCSYRERLAADADREAIRLKQVRAMIPKLGDEFDGKVIGMIETGLFVQVIDPYCEGLVSKDSMSDDAYEFNEEKMIFFGRRKRRMFRIGDPIRVRAVRADLDRRQIDFEPVELTNDKRPEMLKA